MALRNWCREKFAHRFRQGRDEGRQAPSEHRAGHQVAQVASARSIEVGLERLLAACAQSTGSADRRCDELLDALLVDVHNDDVAIVVITLDAA